MQSQDTPLTRGQIDYRRHHEKRRATKLAYYHAHAAEQCAKQRSQRESAARLRMEIELARQHIAGEEWRVCASAPAYEVSSLARVRRHGLSKWHKCPPRILKASPDLRGGYLQVDLIVDGKHRRRPLHQLVAEAFVGPKLPGQEVNHKDNCITNNAPDNLEWLTIPAHHAHTTQNGSLRRGARHPQAKLNETAVRDIRARPNESLRALAQEYAVTDGTILHIRSGKTWRHVK